MDYTRAQIQTRMHRNSFSGLSKDLLSSNILVGSKGSRLVGKSHASEIVLTAVNRLCGVKQPVSQRDDFCKQLSVSTSSLRILTYSCFWWDVELLLTHLFYRIRMILMCPQNWTCSIWLVLHAGYLVLFIWTGVKRWIWFSGRNYSSGVKCTNSIVLCCRELQPLGTLHYSSVEMTLHGVHLPTRTSSASTAAASSF